MRSAPELSNSPNRHVTNLILFDGVCNLCNRFVQFVIERDPEGRFQFAALQSAAARRVLTERHLLSPLPDTVVLVEEGRVFTRSTAALRIVSRLRFPWPMVGALLLIPRPVRDWIYAFVARRRYFWWGKRDHCMVPTPALRSRFLD